MSETIKIDGKGKKGAEVIIDGVDVSECDRYIANDGYMGVYNTPVFKGGCKLPYIGKCQGSECSFKRYKYKEQECEELKEKNQHLINTCCHLKNEIKKHKKAVHKYKVVLQGKIERLYLSRREFLKEINSIPIRIACIGEDFKNALSNFNNAIQVINNEDNYKQALDKIESVADSNLCDDDCDVCPDDCVCDWKVIKDIINKAKENN